MPTLAVALVAFFFGYAFGLSRGTRVQNYSYETAYRQVLSLQTEESKKRLDDAVDAQRQINELLLQQENIKSAVVVIDQSHRAAN